MIEDGEAPSADYAERPSLRALEKALVYAWIFAAFATLVCIANLASLAYNSHFRAELARSGYATKAVIARPGSPIYAVKAPCGKHESLVVQFTTRAGKLRTYCTRYDEIPDGWERFATHYSPNDAVVDLVYDPYDPSHFEVSPGGVVPQRSLDGLGKSPFAIILYIAVPIWLICQYCLFWNKQFRSKLRNI